MTALEQAIHGPEGLPESLQASVRSPRDTVRAMALDDDRPRCPECKEPLALRAMALSKRAEDGQRVCRGVWGCDQRHVWWKWADRPADPLEICPYPDLFTG
ncbi:dehydrogenase [Kitasatospora sp. NPDC048365]|uniref:dehydrogenase n=1 Tax=Kitasatospora sp. NPDC048365 TaxID=3364050 RepID=UPI00370FEE2A